MRDILVIKHPYRSKTFLLNLWIVSYVKNEKRKKKALNTLWAIKMQMKEGSSVLEACMDAKKLYVIMHTKMDFQF